MNDSHVMTLRDGRDLGWLEIGDPEGTPVFAFHGTPGSRLQMTLDETSVRDVGVRLICPDRPGYGLSTYQPERRLVDWPDDVAELADHLGIGDFAVVGVSGGGPHAAVCAALLGPRATSAALVSGVGQLGDPAASEGMIASNRILTRLAQRRSPLLLAMMVAQVAVMRRWPAKAIELMEKQLPEADLAILRRPAVRALFELDASRSSRTTAKAAAQDFEIFAADWGFELSDITVPVHVWQGTADVNVAPRLAHLQHAAIAGSQLHELEGEGHMMVIDHLPEILAALIPR